MSVDMLAAAVGCAEGGWPVFPLHTPQPDGTCSCRDNCGKQCGKHPRTHHGLKDATIDVDQVRAWWTKWPDANIGFRTGVVADVLDIDHADVHEATVAWPLVDMPGGPVVRTGGGWHFYVLPTGKGNRARICGPVDWRGDGGYVILPPSLHASGRRYEWYSPSGLQLQPAPRALLDLLDPPVVARAAGVPSNTDQFMAPGRYTAGKWSPAGIIGQLAMAPDGERNVTLCWAANKLGLDYHAGKATKAEVADARDRLHETALRIGLDEREIVATIKSGFEKGEVGLRNSDRVST